MVGVDKRANSIRGGALKRATKMKIYLFAAWMMISGMTQGSEWLVSLESKVNRSDLVALVTLHWFSESEEKYEVLGESEPLPRVTISLTVNKVLKGTAETKIVVYTYNSNSTVGFSPIGLKIPNEFKTPRRFIAYLKKGKGGVYELAGHSNQYLEDIGPHGISVRDVGQTSERVSLKVKLGQINELCKKAKEKGS